MTYNQQPQQGGWGYPPQQQQPPKKKFGCMKIGLIVLGVLFLIAVIAGVAGSGGSEDSASEQPKINAPEAKPQSDAYRFEFTTSDGAGGDVTFTDNDLNTRQDSTAQSGWSVEVPGKNYSDVMFARLMVQNQGSGDITCRTFKGDELILENTSTGLYSIVTCDVPN